ncbi:MAG: flagellar export protein FliJ [Candidatus Melainabacteria bacterium]|nr:flagellar export protein FliJ [Candidatus Melainabacteria bacterium]
MAKKFKYKFETLLRLKKILKDLQESKLARANLAHQETEQYIQALTDKQHQTYEQMIENHGDGFSLVDHQNQEAYNYKIIGERSKEIVRLAKRERSRDIEQKRFAEHAKSHKGIEKLKDTAFELHQKELLDTEMKQIDDLVISRYRVKDS